MRVFSLVNDIDRQLEDAARAKQQLEAERWLEHLCPRAMRLFAARTAKLHDSRALLTLLVEELYPDDLFTELVGDLARIARRLHVSLATHTRNELPTRRNTRPSRRQFFGSPRPYQGSASLRPHAGLTALTGSRSSPGGHLRDGRRA